MSIPEVVVEVAARALDEHNRPGMWEHESERYKEAFRREARIMLEATAPHMLAEWRKKSFGTSSKLGVSADVEVPIVRTGRPEVTVVATNHPYRSAK